MGDFGIKNKVEDDNSLLSIFNKNKNMLYAVAMDIVHDNFYAEDILHDVYEGIFKQGDKFTSIPNEKRASYLYVSVRNAAINYCNKRKRENNAREENALALVGDENDPISVTVISAESMKSIMKAIKELDEKYRIVLILDIYYDFSDEEIAELLYISTNVVRVRRYRGRKALKIALMEGGFANV